MTVRKAKAPPLSTSARLLLETILKELTPLREQTHGRDCSFGVHSINCAKLTELIGRIETQLKEDSDDR